MKRTVHGNVLLSSITIRIFAVQNESSTVRMIRAKPGYGYTEGAVDEMLMSVADELEKRFPDREYSLVKVGDSTFNFVWRGERKAPAVREPISG